MVSLWRVAASIAALFAVVAVLTARYYLLIPIVYLGVWRIVLSEAFTRLDPLRHGT